VQDTTTLVCNRCGTRYPPGSGYRLECCPDGLLVGEYPRRLEPDTEQEGLWRFTSWLPVAEPGRLAVGSATLAAPELGAAIGLEDLWVSFSGPWPERGAACPTCSFKDLEAAPTLQRLDECEARGVVVATAGNTGRAFAHLGGLLGFPVLVVVADVHLERIWRPELPQADTTWIVALRDADYNDAIELAGIVAPALGWQLEGGVKNVARRDGIGSLLLDAVVATGGLPDHYVQAVGGGPGPIGVLAMAERLVADGRYGDRLPRFHLAQNVEHQPVNRAWRAGRSRLSPDDFPVGSVDVYADVLVNRTPSYEVRGGLYDVLCRSRGQTYAVASPEADHARSLFRETMGIDIMEPVGVALAALEQAVRTGEIAASDRVLLAATGGGRQRLESECELHPPSEVLHTDRDAAPAAIAEMLASRA
jgi:cysteate synthase